jgi:H+/Cl- antiporter ClcA
MSTKLSAGRIRPTYEFIKANRGTFRVHVMCRLLGVARSVAPPLLLMLLFLKPAATALCLGSGVPGGLLTPSLTS